MIASLPMYDWPELQSANDRLWEGLRRYLLEKGIEAPAELARDKGDHSYWLSPELLLGQTCGYPLATQLAGKVQYLATPIYRVEGCSGARYSSAIVVNRESGLDRDSLRGLKLAYTTQSSWSGYRVLIEEFGELQSFFGELAASGGHRNSANMVAEGTAEVAALDAVCWHMLQRYEPQTAQDLKVIGWTRLWPALPFITSINSAPDTLEILRGGFANVLAADAMQNTLEDLAINGVKILHPDSYLPMGEF
ncbi:MAG: PhnD/SsuA/transferrin family substrate-binding protein [Rhizobiaceae bacterium]|nr:PhnD/SsuA/transferrin family substrate-binding protein [Rhizobiaceae bacterium]